MIKLTLVALLTTISLSAFALETSKSYMSVNAGYSWGFNGKSVYTSYNNFTSNSPTSTRAFTKQPEGMVTNINFGYGFNEAMRAEVGLDWNPKIKSTVSIFNLEVKEIGGHGTVAYDFNNNSPFTPFLYGSLGFVSAEATIKASNAQDSTVLKENYPAGTSFYLQNAPGGTVNTTTIPFKKSDAKTLMTYKVGVGLSMKAGEGIDLEVRYGLGGKTQEWTPIQDLAVSATSGAAATGTYVLKTLTVKSIMEHSLTAGLRFTF